MLIKQMIVAEGAKLGVTYDEIMSRSQHRGGSRWHKGGPTKPIVQARFNAIRAVKDGFGHLSTPEIGRIFDRDHTTIMHALSCTAARANASSTSVHEVSVAPDVVANQFPLHTD